MPGRKFVGCCHGDNVLVRVLILFDSSYAIYKSRKKNSTKIPKEEVFRICMYLILEIIRYPSLTNPANTMQIRIPFILNQTHCLTFSLAGTTTF